MRIRRLEIRNYRAIKQYVWVLPPDLNFICLIGPGDSGKSTILEALNMALTDRWTLAISDTDFHETNVSEPIIIRVTLADLTEDIMRHDALGLELGGITAAGNLIHGPEEGSEACITVQLKIDSDLDPQWSIYRVDEPDPSTPLRSGMRRKFGAFKVDDRIDGHLRWTRTSALGRLTESSHGTAGTLAEATRTSRQAVSNSVTPELQALTEKVRDKAHEMGSGHFADLRPGLDTSLSATAGVLALFNGEVPLTNYGLGSRRLAGIAAQRLAYEHKPLALIDEIEYGLEPHRLVHLLFKLRTSAEIAQTITTTHSPVAVEQLTARDLAVVRCDDGALKIHMLRDSEDTIQPMLRAKPSVFLARHIIFGEGRTEYGLLRTLISNWDNERTEVGLPPAAALGVAIAHGDGDTHAAQRAEKMVQIGYKTTILVDTDSEQAAKHLAKASDAGVDVVAWGDKYCIETALCDALGAMELSAFVQLGVACRGQEATVRDDLRNYYTGDITELDVEQWIESGEMDIAAARTLVGGTAKKREWFKSIPKGEWLGRFVWAYRKPLELTPFGATLARVKTSIYGVETATD